MVSLRRPLSWIAVLCLVLQAAALVGAPIVAAAQGEDTCCTGLAPGQSCPMHHPGRDDDTCRMGSACAKGEMALLSLAGGPGVLQDPGAVRCASIASRCEPPFAPAPTSLFQPPDAPPPRR